METDARTWRTSTRRVRSPGATASGARATGSESRALFVVDGDGIIRNAHVSPFTHHLPDIYELYAALDELAQPAEAA